ncbi:MAG: DUF2878 domain-containing protein [Woeseiaceae bacterium]|nr:DUF2878 domain-containing protein [Woeseiaceae bacterium]
MRIALNFLLFQFGWFASVLGSANDLPWIGPAAVAIVVIVHLAMAYDAFNEAALLVSCALIGAVADSLLVVSGWVSYSSGLFAEGLAPYWIIAMWMSFATTLNVSLRWLRSMPRVAVLLGLVAGPMTYYGGAALGGIQLLRPTPALVALGLGWAVLLPLLMKLATYFDGIDDTARRATEATS